MDRINSPDLACGMAMRWFLNKHPKKYQEIYFKIVDKTLGYMNQHSYIKQDIFDLTPRNLKIHRDWLVDNGIIEWQRTDGFTRYRLLEPREVIEKCNFRVQVEQKNNVLQVADDIVDKYM